MSTGAPVHQSDDKIGNYKVVRTLLQGQNSTVMEVVQEGSGKRFAMKQILPSKSKDSAEVKAFVAEAKLGMTLKHPNLVGVHELVLKEKGQPPYFVMDYFPSTHMRLILAKQPLFDEFKPRLHRVIEQAAAGLAYLHDRGYVHRDVKPENIIVNKTGEVRLIDYALAMKIPTGLGKLFAKKPPRQGTHSYMSPDQIRCLPPSPAADIYSFGITIYEFAARRQPFRANSPMELLNKHVRDIPSSPITHDKNITPEFAELVMRMLKKKPADRPQTVHEFLSQFNRVRIFKDDPPPGGDRGFG